MQLKRVSSPEKLPSRIGAGNRCRRASVGGSKPREADRPDGRRGSAGRHLFEVLYRQSDRFGLESVSRETKHFLKFVHSSCMDAGHEHRRPEEPV
jgi:hypothetical protein